MTKEQQFFLTLLSDYIHNRQTKPSESTIQLDWNVIVNYSKLHNLEGIIKYQCRSFLGLYPDCYNHLKQLENAEVTSLFLYTNYSNALKELTNSYQNQGVRFFCVKGLEVASLYPIPAFRTMGDMDIVMSSEDRDRIYTTMTSLGYSLKEKGYEHKYKRGNIEIEIHDHLIYKDNLEISSRRNYFNDYWKYVQKDQDGKYVLDWNFHFLFLVEHTKQHFSGNGVGFRQFMDLALAAKSIPDLDWKWIEEQLRKIDLWYFTITAFAFIERWWGIELPLQTRIIDNVFYEESTEFIFKNGVFGYNNENFKLHILEKKMRISKLPKPLRPYQVVASKVFVPYSYMQKLPYCSFVVDRKYMLPIAWTYRLFYIMSKKRKNIENVRKEVFESDDILEYHSELMDQWGV